MTASDFARDQAEAARAAASNALDGAREGASAARQKAVESMAQAPLLALAGGLAVGAIAAALIPRSEKEKQLLAPVGERISGTAKSALEAAREAGVAKLSEAGLTRDGAADTARSVLDTARSAARSSAEAAIGSIREKH